MNFGLLPFRGGLGRRGDREWKVLRRKNPTNEPEACVEVWEVRKSSSSNPPNMQVLFWVLSGRGGILSIWLWQSSQINIPQLQRENACHYWTSDGLTEQFKMVPDMVPCLWWTFSAFLLSWLWLEVESETDGGINIIKVFATWNENFNVKGQMIAKLGFVGHKDFSSDHPFFQTAPSKYKCCLCLLWSQLLRSWCRRIDKFKAAYTAQWLRPALAT